MRELTRNGIAYNLHKSPYSQDVWYGDECVTYVFSSELYLNKFNERKCAERDKLTASMISKYKVGIECYELSDVILYSKIEKRGFLIRKNNKEATCLDSVRFGQKMKT